MTAPAPLRLAQLTVRGWLALVLWIMGATVLLGAVVGGVLLDRTDQVSRQVGEDIQPARVAATHLQAALRDQETGVRGYLITADRQFLAPYYDGQRAERAAADEIRRLVGGRAELIADLEAVETAAADWRTSYAEPVIAAVTPSFPASSAPRWPTSAKPNSTVCECFSTRRTRTWPTRRPAPSTSSTTSTAGATGCWARWC
ncbi:CHASE3 domain protein [Mycobacterium intracellulare 1956]|uniref:CHASE3 domain protein n=1 Tax=Mycobacterium intracellulare 1956 TaxID=1299331 RepID=X8CJS5_MYCIT|nr:CHASE3 domain protein [Mycobacterium intracellulare 1956]